MAGDPEGLLPFDETPAPLAPETPEPETPAGDTPPDGETPEPAKPAPKPGDPEYTQNVQRRLSKLAAERDTERSARVVAERELAALKRKAEAGARPEPPDLATLTNAEGQLDPAKFKKAQAEYEDRMYAWREAQKAPPAAAEPEVDPAQTERIASFLERAEPLKAQHADFEEVVNRPVFSPDMRDVLWESEVGPQLAYYLGTHQTEALKIANLPAAQMYREMGKLEARLASPAPNGAPAPRTVSNAPAPIEPIRGTTAGSTKDPDKMTMEEFAAWDRQKTMERLKANPLGI